MTDPFSELLKQELGKVLRSTPAHRQASRLLHPDPPITVQLQLDSTQENLFLFSSLIELPPGRFRENVLREALKANGQPDPRAGILGYILPTPPPLPPPTLSPHHSQRQPPRRSLLGAFFELAESWAKAIQNGHSAPPPSALRP